MNDLTENIKLKTTKLFLAHNKMFQVSWLLLHLIPNGTYFCHFFLLEQLLSAVRPIHFSPEHNVFDTSPHPKLIYTRTFDVSPAGGTESVPVMDAYQQAEISACKVSNCPYGKMIRE